MVDLCFKKVSLGSSGWWGMLRGGEGTVPRLTRDEQTRNFGKRREQREGAAPHCCQDLRSVGFQCRSQSAAFCGGLASQVLSIAQGPWMELASQKHALSGQDKCSWEIKPQKKLYRNSWELWSPKVWEHLGTELGGPAPAWGQSGLEAKSSWQARRAQCHRDPQVTELAQS